MADRAARVSRLPQGSGLDPKLHFTYANGAKQVQVVCELLLSSWDGVIRVFHAWPRERNARFDRLRAVGAFLVSAACVNGEMGPITILSEVGGPVVVALPWANARVDGAESIDIQGGMLHFATHPGATYRIEPYEPNTLNGKSTQETGRTP